MSILQLICTRIQMMLTFTWVVYQRKRNLDLYWATRFSVFLEKCFSDGSLAIDFFTNLETKRDLFAQVTNDTFIRYLLYLNLDYILLTDRNCMKLFEKINLMKYENRHYHSLFACHQTFNLYNAMRLICSVNSEYSILYNRYVIIIWIIIEH